MLKVYVFKRSVVVSTDSHPTLPLLKQPSCFHEPVFPCGAQSITQPLCRAPRLTALLCLPLPRGRFPTDSWAGPSTCLWNVPKEAQTGRVSWWGDAMWVTLSISWGRPLCTGVKPSACLSLSCQGVTRSLKSPYLPFKMMKITRS